MADAREQRLAHTFVALADTLVAEFDVLDFLGLLCERAVELLDVTAAGVVLSDQRGGWRTTATSTEDPELVSLFSSQTGGGPSVDCARTSTAVDSADLAGETGRWPEFAPAAVRAGYRALFAVPMRLRTETIGALTLLDETSTSIDEDSAALGQAMADVATIGLLQHRAVHRGESLHEQLQATLHWRIVLEQAKGVLAESGGLSVQQAYAVLRRYAQVHGRRLTELARDLAAGYVSPSELLEQHAESPRP